MNAKIILGLVGLLALVGCGGPIVVVDEAGQAVVLPEACDYDADYQDLCIHGGSAVTCGGVTGIPGTLCQPHGAADGADFWCCN